MPPVKRNEAVPGVFAAAGTVFFCMTAPERFVPERFFSLRGAAHRLMDVPAL